jgi:DNA-binding transcriptional regulator PaaX
VALVSVLPDLTKAGLSEMTLRRAAKELAKRGDLREGKRDRKLVYWREPSFHGGWA